MLNKPLAMHDHRLDTQRLWLKSLLGSDHRQAVTEEVL